MSLKPNYSPRSFIAQSDTPRILYKESCDSWHCLQWGDFLLKLWPAVSYGESILPVLFKTESHDPLHRLYRGVTDDRRESFNNFEGLPCL